jgi:hypothetical protein
LLAPLLYLRPPDRLRELLFLRAGMIILPEA